MLAGLTWESREKRVIDFFLIYQGPSQRKVLLLCSNNNIFYEWIVSSLYFYIPVASNVVCTRGQG